MSLRQKQFLSYLQEILMITDSTCWFKYLIKKLKLLGGVSIYDLYYSLVYPLK